MNLSPPTVPPLDLSGVVSSALDSSPDSQLHHDFSPLSLESLTPTAKVDTEHELCSRFSMVYLNYFLIHYVFFQKNTNIYSFFFIFSLFILIFFIIFSVNYYFFYYSLLII